MTIDMRPPWAEFPRIPWGSIGWRMGSGESFWISWVSWFNNLPADSKSRYKSTWPEGREWQGFYDFIERGELPPHTLERNARVAAAAFPPTKEETKITDPDRFLWMVRHYLKIPRKRVRVLEYGSLDRIYCDPEGNAWRMVIPDVDKSPDLHRPHLERYLGTLIGDDNLEVERPLA